MCENEVSPSDILSSSGSFLPSLEGEGSLPTWGSTSSAYNTRVSAHRHPDIRYPVEEVSHGHATRSFSSSAKNMGNDVTRRIATRASIELNGLCASPIRFIKEGTSQHSDRAQHAVHMHNRSTGKGGTTTRGRGSQDTMVSHTPQIRMILQADDD